jgi:hypothetical protein
VFCTTILAHGVRTSESVDEKGEDTPTKKPNETNQNIAF